MFVLQSLKGGGHVCMSVSVCSTDMCVHVFKCVVCPVPIQEGCILALIGLRKAALYLLWGAPFSCERR